MNRTTNINIRPKESSFNIYHVHSPYMNNEKLEVVQVHTEIKVEFIIQINKLKSRSYYTCMII